MGAANGESCVVDVEDEPTWDLIPSAVQRWASSAE